MALPLDSPLVRRLWVILLAVAVLAFAACATGAVDCAIGKPVGLAAAIGAAALSFLDPMRERQTQE
jgi:hypothetical protein